MDGNAKYHFTLRLFLSGIARGVPGAPHPPLRAWEFSANPLIPEIQNVNVSAESHVVGKIVAGIVRVVVEHDVIGVPLPAIYKDKVNGGNAEEEAAEPETIATASAKPPYMTRAESARETAVLPGVIEVVARIISAFIVPDPLIIAGMNVGRVGVSSPVVEFAVVRGRRLRGTLFWSSPWRWRCVLGRSGPASWNVPATNLWMAWAAALRPATLRSATFPFLRERTD